MKQENYIARIECGEDSGTGFLVQNNRVLTALHNVSEHNSRNISLSFPYNKSYSEEVNAKLIDYNADFDIALLEIETVLSIDEYIGINVSKTVENEKWETFGFPITKWTPGSKVTGAILRSNIENKQLLWDIELSYDQKIEQFGGFSGSPIIVKDKIKGIILQELDGTIAAISTFKIKPFLDKNNILYEHDGDPLGLIVEENIDAHVNIIVVNEIENKLKELENGYIFLKGNPGSGKSTIVMDYSPIEDGIKLIGKYLVRDKNDGLSIAYKSSAYVFAEWIEKALWNELYLEMPPKKDRKLHEWIEHIHQLFTLLSHNLTQKETKGILFVDGIEDVYFSDKIQDFFSLLPEGLPKNIFIVLACQSEEFLPILLKSCVNENNVVNVVPLDSNLSRYIVNKRLKDPSLSFAIKEAIVAKADGHPLFLRYLIEESIHLEDECKISEWLKHTPNISGDIKIYYESLWNRLQTKPNELYTLATIARMRDGVDTSILKRALPSHFGSTLMVTLPNIRYLLDYDQNISIYHSSFAVFIIEKTEMLDQEIHTQVTEFCKEEENHWYSINNILYHMLRQKEDLKKEGVKYCNQVWVDRCTANHIKPDLIVSDVYEVLSYALSNNVEAKETIRLLLLDQRINFRYNNLFVMYAAEFANLLIQKKEFAQAMTYIVREGFLVIEDESAIDLLIQFLNNNAIQEAQQIFHIFKQRLLSAMESDDVKFKIIGTYYKALAVLTSYQSDNPEQAFSREFLFLLKQIDYIDDENKEDYMDYCMSIISFQKAFLIFNNNQYTPIKVYEELGIPLENRMIDVLISTLKELLKLEEDYHNKNNSSDGKQNLLKDIQYVFESNNLNTADRQIFLLGLIDNKFDVTFIDSLIREVISEPNLLSLREKNGVDTNYKFLYKLSTYWLYKGFINYESKYPKLKDDTWEQYLESVISLVGYIKGMAWRARCDGNETKVNDLANMLKSNLYPFLNLQLKERATWKRSYFIPEDTLVFIYQEISCFYRDYCPTRVHDILDFLLVGSNNQLGIYTEGYRETIFTVLATLKSITGVKRKIFELSKKLEKHIILGVQNRWERTEDLIKLTNIYIFLENEGSFYRVFQELLNSSMGPSWYKEDQLSLIRSSLISLKQTNKTESYLGNIASILEHASGEMTFQRYVRVEKEEFIGMLCKIGNVRNSIEYLKEQVLPSPNVLQEKAESTQIDYIDRGKGYKFGIGNIEEQSAILEILENNTDMHPLLKWGYCELFIIGDLRYLKRFASIMGEIISNSPTSNNREVLFKRLLKICISDMTIKERSEFLENIELFISPEHYKKIRELIEKNNIEIEIKDVSRKKDDNIEFPKKSSSSEANIGNEDKVGDELFFPGTFGNNYSIEQFNQIYLEAIDEMEMDNYFKAKEKVVQGLNLLQKGGWNIWSGNLNPNVSQAFKLLAKISDNANDFIMSIGPLILEEKYALKWQIVKKVIDVIGHGSHEEEAADIFGEIIDHLTIMVRPPEELNDYYKWLNQKQVVTSTNIEMAQLFIWYLNNPSSHIRYRGPEILRALARIDPNFFIPIILDNSFNLNSDISAEVCAGVIYSIALEEIDLILMFITQEYIINRIKDCDHFTIKYTYIKILELGNVSFFETGAFSPLKISISANEENDNLLRNTLSIFEVLEQNNLWNSQNYLELQQSIIDNNGGLSINDLFRIDSYLSIAYRKQRGTLIIKSEVFKAINKVLVRQLYEEDAEKIYKLLCRINPNFPAEQIRLNSIPSKEKDIKNFITGKISPEIFLSEGKYQHLHYLEFLYSDEAKSLDFIEITGFARKGERIITDEFDLEMLAWTYKQNGFPDFSLGKRNTFSYYEPLIFKGELNESYYGGTITPAYINKEINILSNFQESDIIRESWIEGRSWEYGKVGIPLREGSRLLISKEKVDLINHIGWKLGWFVNYNDEYAFVIDPEKKEIIQLW